MFPKALPDWVAKALPDKKDSWVWAPDVVQFRGRYFLYYAVSALFGRNESAIGVATNPTLDPADPRYRWTDQGPVIVSVLRGDPAKGIRGNWEARDAAIRNESFNAIDPGPVVDGDRLWLSFGSYWTGIYLLPLDPATGRRSPVDTGITRIAYYDADANHVHAIEAPYIERHGKYRYLFVNWDYCCRGVQSNYNIRVGRSPRITGPYLDHAGKEMLQGGGTLLLGSEGNEIGPGHAGLYSEGAATWLSYHYYDGANQGRPKLGIRRLIWTTDGWPALVARPIISPSAPAALPSRRGLHRAVFPAFARQRAPSRMTVGHPPPYRRHSPDLPGSPAVSTCETRTPPIAPGGPTLAVDHCPPGR